MSNEFTILGGGIAGLTAAIALKKAGITATVYEAAPEIKPVGAGLALAANAIKAFDRLGIAAEVIAAGRQLQQFTVYDSRGKKISRINCTRVAAKHGINNFTILRAELHRVLLAQLDPGQVHTGKRVKQIREKGAGYSVLFEDGSSCETKYLVAAEGIHSPVRQHFLPASKLRYSGYTCWRGLADNAQLQLEETSETWGTKGRFGIVPLKDNQVYWFACVNSPAQHPGMKALGIDGLLKIFGDFHTPVPEVIRATAPENLLWNDINDLEPIGRYAFGNAVLLGDAAHATTPNMGQGACQAIEDAVVLMQELEKTKDVAVAFLNYEKRRLPRTHYVVNRSWTIGKMAQWENRLAAGLRNTLFRMVPETVGEKQLEALYEVDF